MPGYAYGRSWHSVHGEFEELLRARKSPIGWEPYFEEILGAGNTRLAGRFVQKCTSLSVQERSEMYVKTGMIADAAKELAKAKDVGGLEQLRGQTSDRNALLEIERLLGQLKPKR